MSPRFTRVRPAKLIVRNRASSPQPSRCVPNGTHLESLRLVPRRPGAGERLLRRSRCPPLVVEKEVHERAMDAQPAVVVDEAQLPKFVHETIDPRARAADHFCQRLLTDAGKDGLGFSFFAKVRQQE